MDERRVPVYVPVWEDANKVRPWDGSGEAQAWVNLMDSRDRALPESAARVIAAGEGDGTNVLGLVSVLWGIDESEVAKILQARMGSVSERGAERGAWRRNPRQGRGRSGEDGPKGATDADEGTRAVKIA